MFQSMSTSLLYGLLLAAAGRQLAQAAAATSPALLPPLPLSNLVLPPGFSIHLYTPYVVQDARSLVLSEGSNGAATIVYASSNSDVVNALVDEQSNGTVVVKTILSNQNNPMGIAWYNGSLFVATIDAVSRYDDVDQYALSGQTLPDPVTLLGGLPQTADHAAKYIAIGPDEKLYINFGAPCNICELESTGVRAADNSTIMFGSIARMNLDGTGLETYTTGIRNVVGMTFQPETGVFYFSNNGRDNIGGNRTLNTPDDYIAAAPVPGLDFGFPYCDRQGFGDAYLREVGPGVPIVDPNVTLPEDAGNTAESQLAFCNATSEPPVQVVGPHVATLGLRFYTGDMLPLGNNTIINAQHGSWNRPANQKIGYRVMTVTLDDAGEPIEYAALVDGFLDVPSGTITGRPADVLVLPDGSVLVSDDQASAVYRITYDETAAMAPTATLPLVEAPGQAVAAAGR